MMKKNNKLLAKTTSMLEEIDSNLKDTLEGLSPIYAKIIFARRMEFGYSQKELAEKAHIGTKTISRAEGGYDNLSIETYDKIFYALDLKIDDVARAMIQIKSDYDELASTTM